MPSKLPTTISQVIDQFSGRGWLLSVLSDWLTDRSERILLLVGGPGTGKSMISAWLAGHGPLPDDEPVQRSLETLRQQVVAAHFLQANTRNLTPQAFVESVAQQLAVSVPGFGDALAESLSDRVQIQVTQNIQTVASGSSVTGVSIGTLNLVDMEDSLSFDRGFVQPLRQVGGGEQQPLVILVDALDEAWADKRGQQLVRLLAQLNDLPAPVRIVMTTRPDPRVLKLFGEAYAYRFHLVSDAPDDGADIYDFAHSWLLHRQQLAAQPAAQLAKQIQLAAEGMFLYAYMVMRDLIPKMVTHSASVGEFSLPKGLSGFFHSFLTRELGQDEDRWYEELRSLLGLIAIAQGDGLNRRQLKRMLGRDPTRDLRICHQYLSGALNDGPFRIFHKSLADFLLEDEDNLDYEIDAAEMHKQLVGQVDLTLSDWRSADAYVLQYLPYHLSCAGKQRELEQLLLNFSYLQAKLARSNIGDLVNDFDYLSPAKQKGQHKGTARLVQDALRLSSHILAEDKGQLPSQLFGRLLPLLRLTITGKTDLASQLAQFTVADTPDSVSAFCYNMGTHVSTYSRETWLRPYANALVPVGGPLQRTLSGMNMTNGVVVSPDGRLSLCHDDSNRIWIWDLHSGTLKTVINSPRRRIFLNCSAIHPAKPIAVVGVDEGGIFVVDMEAGVILRELAASKDLTGIAFTSNGNRVLSSHRRGLVEDRPLDGSESRREISVGSEDVAAIVVSEPSREGAGHSTCAFLAVDTSVEQWDLTRAQCLKRFGEHSSAIETLALSMDGQCLAVGCDDGEIELWNVAKGTRRSLAGHRDQEFGNIVSGLAFTPDGTQLISSSWDSTVRL